MNWNVVIPVKRLDEAKSRLRPALPDVADLALAFAVDTVTAALGADRVGRVIVVTDDPVVRDAILSLASGWRGTVPPVTVIDDPGAGLNAAVTAGVRATAALPVVVLTADLPSISAGDIAAALRLADAHDLSMVTDADGSGTTMLASRHGGLAPSFGPDSRARHEAAGHTVLEVGVMSALHRDVDTAADLHLALALGVGPRTAQVMTSRVAALPIG